MDWRLTKRGPLSRLEDGFRDPDFMNERSFVILYICAPSMYGYASGREPRHQLAQLRLGKLHAATFQAVHLLA